MSNSNSQEQTIYRSLAWRIQLGFYDDGGHFPSANEIACKYQASYCPAQRALKMLEQDGLIRLCRGKSTVVLKKPYENYLETGIFRQRALALSDLNRSLMLISPPICLQSIYHMDDVIREKPLPDSTVYPGRLLYGLFEYSIKALKSQTVLSLYYDISNFAQSSFFDILNARKGEETARLFLQDIWQSYLQCITAGYRQAHEPAGQQLEHLGQVFFRESEDYLASMPAPGPDETQEAFTWEPRKGRTRYCDIVAIDMVCKINQGIYPVGTLLPNGSVLADIYHVSDITMRRTISLMNRLGVTKTFNGVGTRVISRGDSSIPYRLKDMTLDDNMKSFLEALQILAITGGSVFRYVFPHIPEEALDDIALAVAIPQEKRSMVAALSAGMQAVVRHCPLAAIREIYSRITLLLLKGSVLRLEETGDEPVPQWDQISQSIRESLDNRDSAQFGRAYQMLFEANFASTKLTLVEIGVNGADEVADIIHPSQIN